MDYSAEVEQRFATTARAGDVPEKQGASLEGSAEDPSLGFWIRFQVRLHGASIEQVRFRAYGCPQALAAADLVAESLEGRSVDALARIDRDAIARRLGLPREKHGLLLRLEDALAVCHSQAMNEQR